MTSQVIDRPRARRDDGAQPGPTGSEHASVNATGKVIIMPVPSYAVGLLTHVDQNEEIVQYLRRIDDTLEPFGGRFLIHGSAPAEKEGSWPGALIVIEFPEPDAAQAWYDSGAYQEIIPLRTNNAHGWVALFEGVAQPHRGIDALGGGVQAATP